MATEVTSLTIRTWTGITTENNEKLFGVEWFYETSAFSVDNYTLAHSLGVFRNHPVCLSTYLVSTSPA